MNGIFMFFQNHSRALITPIKQAIHLLCLWLNLCDTSTVNRPGAIQEPFRSVQGSPEVRKARHHGGVAEWELAGIVSSWPCAMV